MYQDIYRSRPKALYSYPTIIGYLVQYPRPCFAHRPDSSSVFTSGLGLTQCNHSINISLIYDCMIPFYITRYDILYFHHINLIRLASPNARPQLRSETTRSLDGGTHSSRSPCMRRYDYIADTCKELKAEQRSISPPDYTYIHQMSHIYCGFIA